MYQTTLIKVRIVKLSENVSRFWFFETQCTLYKRSIDDTTALAETTLRLHALEMKWIGDDKRKTVHHCDQTAIEIGKVQLQQITINEDKYQNFS